METENLKAVLREDKPTFNRGDKIKINGAEVAIRNVYSRRLEDLTFNDLEMIGYSNPNLFVKEWDKEHGSFDEGMTVWVVAYVEGEEE